ncbi:MAG: hypothetical protein GY906_04015 [bacterium]|nr:hypothetical protein [bacterium]
MLLDRFRLSHHLRDSGWVEQQFLCSISILLALALSGCRTELEIDFLGQEPPGATPTVFAPGLISTEFDEYGCTMSPDGREFYFTRTFVSPRSHTIMVCRKTRKGWSAPEIAAFSSIQSEAEPIFSPTGDSLFFSRVSAEEADGDPGIFVLRRTTAGWSKPEYLRPGMFATSSLSGTLFFTDVSSGIQEGNIAMVTSYEDGSSESKLLDGTVNSLYQDAHPFVAPDESFVIFDSNRPGGHGSSDLYISFRDSDRQWGEAINLGAPINTPEYDAIPSLSPDGKYLFFYRSGDIYWVSTNLLQTLSRATSVNNG